MSFTSSLSEEFRLYFAFKRRYFFSTITTFVSNLIIMGGIILVSIPSISALSPLGLTGVIVAQFLPSYVGCLVETLVAVILLSLAFGLHVMWSFGPIILNSVIAALGMLGLGYILGGLTIRYKQLGLVKNLLFVLLFALGIMPMGYESAEGLSWFARFFPFTQGLIRTRRALLPESACTTSIPLWLFVGCSAALLCLGILVFRRFERRSLREGTLASY